VYIYGVIGDEREIARKKRKKNKPKTPAKRR
jgi:hypothetical protein